MAVLQAKNSARCVLLPARCVVGRSRACDLELADDHVSGQHAAIEWTRTSWSVRDLGSRNGTFVDGRRLAAGEQVELHVGQELRFGRSPSPWVLTAATPPALMAVRLSDGASRAAEGGYLVLPDEHHPEHACYADGAAWVSESDGEPRPLADRALLRTADGALWRVHLPICVDATVRDEDTATLASLCLRFAYTRDEEHVELVADLGDRRLDLKTRAHHYLLLVLARQRLADRGAGVSLNEQGWIRQEDLIKMLRIEEGHLNINIHRARTQLSQLGVLDAAGVVERRSGTRQIRLGVDRIELAPLDPCPKPSDRA